MISLIVCGVIALADNISLNNYVNATYLEFVNGASKEGIESIIDNKRYSSIGITRWSDYDCKEHYADSNQINNELNNLECNLVKVLEGQKLKNENMLKDYDYRVLISKTKRFYQLRYLFLPG